VRVAFLVLATALTAAAQPKLLINAQVDTRAAMTGLENEFQSLLAVEPQPAWIGYAVPSIRSYNLGCDYVSPGGRTAPGVVHLEPPDQAVVLFRIVGRAVDRLRVLSPDCEIDAGGVPVHWLTGIRPSESVALLSSIDRNQAVMAIAMHADAAADMALEKLIASTEPEAVRRRAAFWIGASRGRHGLDIILQLLRADPSPAVRERAILGVSQSRDPEAVDLLISTARQDREARVRRQAMNAIGRSRDPRAQAFLENLLR
jgi:HEAT repeat protein